MQRRKPAISPRPGRRAGVAQKQELHPRNRHRGRYDFARLTARCPYLAPYVARNRFGDAAIDFADPAAVTALNRAILEDAYGIRGWEIPAGYLCPPIPGRVDHLHHLADLLAADNRGIAPRGPAVRALDIGTGASCIHPLLGHAEYGWRFVGSEIDAGALAAARRILAANRRLEAAIELRVQRAPARVFAGIVQPGEFFDLIMCNPPFHASLAEATAGTRRKWRNLGKASTRGAAPVLNFGGHGAELWCTGGEAGFVGRMVAESVALGDRCLWFSSLLSKQASLPIVLAAVRRAGAVEHRVIAMAQGQKRSRIVAWTLLSAARRGEWRERQWR